jgi:polyisoprenoid-binding protein YceI
VLPSRTLEEKVTMPRWIRASSPLLVLTAVLLIAPGRLPAEPWKIDAAHSAVEFSVRHMMVSNVKGRFSGLEGTIDFDGKDFSAARVQVAIPARTIDTANAKRDDHLRNPDFLDVAKFPDLTFRSTKVEPTGEKSFKIAGDRALHGVTKPVEIAAEYSGTIKDPAGKVRAGFSGSTKIDRKEFGITWNKTLDAGGVAVGDEVKISLEIEAVAGGPAPAPPQAASPAPPIDGSPATGSPPRPGDQ